MNSLTLALTTFACITAGLMLGFFLRNRLPAHHLKDESKDAVKLGSGLVATMAALVLGLLVSSAKSSFDTMNDGLKQSGAKIIVLDRVLSKYGPETKETRALLRKNIENAMATIWPEEQNHRVDIATIENSGGMDAIQDRIRALTPQNDQQRMLHAQALQISNELSQTRWLLIEHTQNSLPTPFLVILICWLTLLYASFGMLTPWNGTVLTILLVCAMSVSSAIFLIREMNTPVDGIIKLSKAPFEKALQHVGK